MEAVVAVVPIKRLAEAKGRLRARLSDDTRVTLVISLLRSVLATLAATGVITERLVISPDEEVLAVARAAGATALRQHNDGLNEALVAAGAHVPPTATLLVVPGDLALLEPSDILAVLALAGTGPAVVIAPDRVGRGTNLLLARPAGALPFSFGPDSFARHRAAAVAAGIPVAIYHARGTAFDLDTPEDLDTLPPRALLAVEHHVAIE